MWRSEITKEKREVDSVTCANVAANSTKSRHSFFENKTQRAEASRPLRQGKREGGRERGRKGVYYNLMTLHSIILASAGSNTRTLAASYTNITPWHFPSLTQWVFGHLGRGMCFCARMRSLVVKKKACCPFKRILHAKLSNEPLIPLNPKMFDKIHMVGY